MISEDSIPPPKLLPKSGIFLPHIVVAGDSFPHTKYLMTPYTSQNLEQSPKKAVYNARHFQAMSVATDTIGLFVQRFRNFSKTWFSSYEFTTKMVKACCILHNFLRRKDIERNLGQFDPDEVREVVRKTNIFMPLPSYFGVSTTIAQEVRENFCTHFLSENHSESKFVVQEDSKNSIVEGTDSCIVNMKIEIEYPEVDGSADDSLQSAKNCPMQQISTSEEVHGNLLRRLLLEAQSTPNFCVDEVVKENSIVERTGECTVNVKTELKSSEPEGTEECTVNVKTEIKSESDDSEEWKTESIAHCSYSNSQ